MPRLYITSFVMTLSTLTLATRAVAGRSPQSGNEFRFPAAGVDITLPRKWHQVNHKRFSEIARWEVTGQQGKPSARMSLDIKPLRDLTFDKWLSELAHAAGGVVEDSSIALGGERSKLVRSPKFVILVCRRKHNVYVLDLAGKDTSNSTVARLANLVRFVPLERPHLHLGKLTEKIALLDTGWTMRIPAPLRFDGADDKDSNFYGVQNYVDDKSEMGLEVVRGKTTPERSFEDLVLDVSAGVKRVITSQRDIEWRSVRPNVSVMTKLRPKKANGKKGDPSQIMGAVVRYDESHFVWVQFSVFVSDKQVSQAYAKAIQAMVDTITPP